MVAPGAPDGSDGTSGVISYSMMPRPLRALASLIVGITTVIGMMVYQHYSREPATDVFAVAVTTAATILAWLVTGLE